MVRGLEKGVFDKVGEAYAKRYRELELARKQFEHQSGEAMKRLQAVARKAMRDAKIPDPLRIDEKPGWWEMYLSGRYVEARQEVHKKIDRTWVSGIGAFLLPDALGDGEEESFGFGSSVFFTISNATFRKLRTDDLAELLTKAPQSPLRHNPRIFWTPNYAEVRTCWMPMDDAGFGLENMEATIRALPLLFSLADGWMTSSYLTLKRE